jgi:hypothetical protein
MNRKVMPAAGRPLMTFHRDFSWWPAVGVGIVGILAIVAGAAFLAAGGVW